MKKIILAFTAVAAISFSAKASGKHTLFIPATVTSSFEENFPGVTNVVWQPDNIYMKAVFVKDNASENAYFTYDGDLMGTTKSVAFTDLPATAQKHIQEKYKDYQVDETILFNDNDAENESEIFSVPDNEINYLVSLKKDNKILVLKVTTDGQTAYYTEKDL